MGQAERTRQPAFPPKPPRPCAGPPLASPPSTNTHSLTWTPPSPARTSTPSTATPPAARIRGWLTRSPRPLAHRTVPPAARVMALGMKPAFCVGVGWGGLGWVGVVKGKGESRYRGAAGFAHKEPFASLSCLSRSLQTRWWWCGAEAWCVGVWVARVGNGRPFCCGSRAAVVCAKRRELCRRHSLAFASREPSQPIHPWTPPSPTRPPGACWC